MSGLKHKQCVPCRGGIPPLKGEAVAPLRKQLEEGWNVVREHHLEKSYRFANFREALAFTNRVGALAETEGHHPEPSSRLGKSRCRNMDPQDRRPFGERFHSCREN